MLEVVCIDDKLTRHIGIGTGQRCWIDPDSIDVDRAGVRFADFYVRDMGSFTGYRYLSTLRTSYFRPTAT